MRKQIISYFKELVQLIEVEHENINNLEQALELLIKVYQRSNKILVCGNGGSAADSQHFVAELVGRYKLERRSYNAIALSTDTSIMTAVGNDYGFEYIFSRQVEGLGSPGDLLVVFSTSGNSLNIINAINKAKEKNITVLSFTGKNGGKIKNISDINININSFNTPRIQEMHGFYIHVLCELLEISLEE